MLDLGLGVGLGYWWCLDMGFGGMDMGPGVIGHSVLSLFGTFIKCIYFNTIYYAYFKYCYLKVYHVCYIINRFCFIFIFFKKCGRPDFDGVHLVFQVGRLHVCLLEKLVSSPEYAFHFDRKLF